MLIEIKKELENLLIIQHDSDYEDPLEMNLKFEPIGF